LEETLEGRPFAELLFGKQAMGYPDTVTVFQIRGGLRVKVTHHEAVEQRVVEMPGSEGCQVRWLIGSGDGAPNFAMRQFEVAAGGFTPRHSHPYEHEVYVLGGEGTIAEGDQLHRIAQGDVIYVAPNEIHQFRNTGSAPLTFLCLVPNDHANLPVTQQPECGVEVD
jgi:quercetin dioxygenase-like cupin family protein